MPESTPFQFEVEDARGNITSVGGKEITGGVTRSGTGYTLTFSGGPGRTKVCVYLPLDKADRLAEQVLAQVRSSPGQASPQ